MDHESFHKKLISPLRGAMYDFSESEVLKQLDKLLEQECVVRLCYPLGAVSYTHLTLPTTPYV